MSSNTNLSKKRRLESEVSQGSGITYLSNVTTTTELSSDLDDSVSDSSANNVCFGPNTPCFASNTVDGVQNQTNSASRKGPIKKVPRQRQVSFSTDFDEDETFAKSSQQFAAQKPFYDNSVNGTFSGVRRTRRATESNLETHEFSTPQHLIPGDKNEHCRPPHRSHTTSEILYGHEVEIQNQRRINELIRQHDAARNAQRLQSRRSQSVTSLRGDPMHMIGNSNGRLDRYSMNTYESLQPLSNRMDVPPAPQRSMETVVKMRPDGRHYIHPVPPAHAHRQNQNEAVVTGNGVEFVPQDEESNTGGSSYVGVNPGYSDISTSSWLTCCSFKSKNSFFRKGFYILLVFNVIFISVTTSVIVLMATKENKPEEPKPGETRSQEVCLPCDNFLSKDQSKFGIRGNECCGSIEKTLQNLLEAQDKKTLNFLNIIKDKTGFKVPVIQLKAAGHNNGRIRWNERPDISMGFDVINNTKIRIKNEGYYYIYSRVRFTIEKSDKLLSLGHKVKKESNDNKKESTIDETVQKYFPTQNELNHTHLIAFTQYLGKGDHVFVKLQVHDYKSFQTEGTMFGMFLAAT